eukprot:70881_1
MEFLGARGWNKVFSGNQHRPFTIQIIYITNNSHCIGSDGNEKIKVEINGGINNQFKQFSLLIVLGWEFDPVQVVLKINSFKIVSGGWLKTAISMPTSYYTPNESSTSTISNTINIDGPEHHLTIQIISKYFEIIAAEEVNLHCKRITKCNKELLEILQVDIKGMDLWFLFVELFKIQPANIFLLTSILYTIISEDKKNELGTRRFALSFLIDMNDSYWIEKCAKAFVEVEESNLFDEEVYNILCSPNEQFSNKNKIIFFKLIGEHAQNKLAFITTDQSCPDDEKKRNSGKRKNKTMDCIKRYKQPFYQMILNCKEIESVYEILKYFFRSYEIPLIPELIDSYLDLLKEFHKQTFGFGTNVNKPSKQQYQKMINYTEMTWIIINVYWNHVERRVGRIVAKCQMYLFTMWRFHWDNAKTCLERNVNWQDDIGMIMAILPERRFKVIPTYVIRKNPNDWCYNTEIMHELMINLKSICMEIMKYHGEFKGTSIRQKASRIFEITQEYLTWSNFSSSNSANTKYEWNHHLNLLYACPISYLTHHQFRKYIQQLINSDPLLRQYDDLLMQRIQTIDPFAFSDWTKHKQEFIKRCECSKSVPTNVIEYLYEAIINNKYTILCMEQRQSESKCHSILSDNIADIVSQIAGIALNDNNNNSEQKPIIHENKSMVDFIHQLQNLKVVVDEEKIDSWKEAIKLDGIDKIYEFNYESPLGQGTFGIVYRVKRIDTGKVYAIKVLKRYTRSAAIEIAVTAHVWKFQTETINVVKIFDVEKYQNCVYIVMEQAINNLYSMYMSGSNGKIGIYAFANSKIPLHLMKQLVDGVECLHKMGITHCDIKPENALLYPGGILKIGDLGCAHIGSLTGIKGVVGTPDYQAPEMKNGEEYTSAIDVWSLGVLIFEVYYGGNAIRRDENGIIFDDSMIYPFEGLKELKCLLNFMLSEDPNKRIKIHDVKENIFFVEMDNDIDQKMQGNEQMDANEWNKNEFYNNALNDNDQWNMNEDEDDDDDDEWNMNEDEDEDDVDGDNDDGHNDDGHSDDGDNDGHHGVKNEHFILNVLGGLFGNDQDDNKDDNKDDINMDSNMGGHFVTTDDEWELLFNFLRDVDKNIMNSIQKFILENGDGEIHPIACYKICYSEKFDEITIKNNLIINKKIIFKQKK